MEQIADLTFDQYLILMKQVGKIVKWMNPQGTGATEEQPAVPPDWDMIKSVQPPVNTKGYKGYGSRSRH